jgi:hypothetical protein
LTTSVHQGSLQFGGCDAAPLSEQNAFSWHFTYGMRTRSRAPRVDRHAWWASSLGVPRQSARRARHSRLLVSQHERFIDVARGDYG